jgi:hypothetical protein
MDFLFLSRARGKKDDGLDEYTRRNMECEVILIKPAIRRFPDCET